MHGGVDTGWTFYTPYSTVYSNGWVVVTAVGIFISGFSSILTGLNFLVTIHTMRAPGMTWMRMPLFCWGMYATGIIQILGTPVIAITLLLVAAERLFHLGIFNPAEGGDPVLFQHLFWFYSHPAVYIMILPALAIISELVTAFSRKPIFGYKFIAASSVAIAVLSFLVWGHHMFVSGQSVYAGLVFSILSFMVAIPSAIKVFNWTATLYKGSISYQTPMLYALGFIGLFTFGGLTGLMLASLGLDIHVHDTYFIVAHFHYIMVGGTIMAYLGGLHYWWPKISGKLYPEYWSRVSAWVIFIGFNLTFFPQFIVGYLGMPRRYHAYPDEFQILNVMSTAGASILGIGYVIPLVYFWWSMRYGKDAADNPWGATGLEWETPSPPPTENFPETPVVTGRPYDYTTIVEEEKAVGLTRNRPRRGARRSPAAAPPFRRHGGPERGLLARDVDVPRHRGPLLRRDVHGLRRVSGELPPGIRGRLEPARPQARRLQHRGPDPVVSDDGARRVGGLAGQEEADHSLPPPDDAPRGDVPRRQGRRVQAEVRAPRGPGTALRRAGRDCLPRASSSSRSTSA